MKLILSSFVLTSLAQSSRLLQQADACTLQDCGADECHVNPINGEATCCAPDDLCADADYQSTDVAVCMDDGGLQKYDNKCFGRCDGNSACGILCTCDTDADCATGYSCLETPFGFSGCDQNVGNSCFGFCATQRQGACGGVVGPAGCTAEETCYLDSTPPSNPLGDCWSLPDSCPQTTPSPSACGGVENCAAYSDGCSNCECDTDGTVTCNRIDTCERDPDTGEIIRCFPCDPLRPPYSCDRCADGYYADGTGGCAEIPTCGGIDFCTSFTADSCGNGCSCIGREFPVCTLIQCDNPDPSFQSTCTACIDGYKPSSDGLSCEPDLGCFCPLFFDPVCCDGTTYGNTCQANCGGCSGIITPGACPAPSPETVKCTSKNDCDRGYKCKKDPICRIDSSIKCRDVDKVCVSFRRKNSKCSSDDDCDTKAGEICLLSNYIGICVNYQSPSTSP